MSIKYHLSSELLLNYSAGSLDEAASLLVATHLALCPHCRSRNNSIDALGGYMLDSLEASEISPAMMASALDRIQSDPSPPAAATPPRVFTNAIIPEPLRSYVGGDLDTLRWRRLAPRVCQIPIETVDSITKARLLRFQSGVTVPMHGHRGRELTLILSGELCDRDVVLRRGDIVETDEKTEHQPFAGPGEDCICLAVTDAPLRFKSMLARLLQPILGM